MAAGGQPGLIGKATEVMGGAGGVSSRMATSRRWIWLLAASVVLVDVVAVAAWQLLPFTGIGIPDERYSTTPEPCELLAAETVPGLAGSSAGERSVLTGGSGWRPAAYRETTLRCEWDAPGGESGPVTVTVERFVGAQFGLGPSGAEKAELATGAGACVPELTGGRDNTCVWGGTLLDDVRLNVRRENVVVDVDLDNVVATPEEGEELMATLAAEVLSRLDEV
jgi:hypothetical protein